MSKKSTLYLVDGSSYLYRAFHALPNLTNSRGEPTGALLGVANMLRRLLKEHDPQFIAVVFDAKGPTFRHEMYPDYKANRKPMPAELAEQVPRLRELLDAWGLAVLEVPEVEADDVMATLARRSEDVCDRVWFFTGDKDFLQLLDERTGMLKPGRRGDEITAVTADDVRRQYGMEPPNLVNVFALAGDKADNIPGAPGVERSICRGTVSRPLAGVQGVNTIS